MNEIKKIIESTYEHYQKTKTIPDPNIVKHIDSVINLLDQGKIRVAEQSDNGWITNEWVKKAILLHFVCSESFLSDGNYTRFFDKIPSKFAKFSKEDFISQNIRVVPDAYVRKGAFIGQNSVLMPSFVNIGAYVDSNVMVDSWATVGSCAQIGKNVHISDGAGIGGVLEPLQATPTIIEDDCFIGARSEIVEGVIVEKGSVIAMGVYIGKSTKIYNRATGEIITGRVPSGSVVVSGSLPAKDNSHSVYAAIIVKQVDQKTLDKVAINEMLHDD